MMKANELLKQEELTAQQIMQRDYARLMRESRRGLKAERAEQWRERVKQSAQLVSDRAQSLPALEYDDILPITARREDLIKAIQKHQVLVVAGDTGSGKSTQLPKICLEAGRGQRGLIGCTQPRRLAARSVAARVAEEMKAELGQLVGFQVRFTDRSDQRSLIKFMTDGIMLAEIPRDRWLDQYDTIIIDEAHERSLNIDFLLGYIKRVLPKRPDLRVIITSATIDTERFSKHFNDAPVFNIEGRTYPVEVRYRPPEEEGERDRYRAIVTAVEELNSVDARGDVLVFLSGEREIREAAEVLRRRQFRHTSIQPLYARLSAKAQMAVFHPGPERRIVLATNVAETSLTVPRIRFVIDTGLARISRYSHRSRIQRLPIEPVSQASANQRKGRCGRLGPGVCIRLYSEEDFELRPEFTEPEILRTSLASVILRLQSMGLGDVEAFPFIEPPPRAMISDAFQLLQELQAVDADRAMTDIGRRLSRLPVDVRLGRMLLAGHEQGCLKEMLILCAVLAIQDPRERPIEAAQAADEAHAQFQDVKSDFVGLLNLYKWISKTRAESTSSAYRKALQQGFLSWTRVREWQDLRHQLAQICLEVDMKPNTEAAEGDAIHAALLSGLLSHVGRRDDEEKHYQGARGRRFHVFPGSALFKGKNPWVMCAEIVETAKVYGRTVASIKPEWLERQGAHLLRHRYFDPYWDRRSGRVMGFVQSSLYGLTLVEKRRVHYGPHDTTTAQRLFVEHALVQGEFNQAPDFIAKNQALVETLRDEEHKRRRHDLLVREERLLAFFIQQLPETIYTQKAFTQWYKKLPPEQKQQLEYSRELLLQQHGLLADAEDYPESLDVEAQIFPLRYHFDPGHAEDGVTVAIPLHALNTLSEAQVSWLVPGLLEEKVIALINTLPKPLRRALTPSGRYAQAVLESVEHMEGHLHDFLAREIKRMTGLNITREQWNEAQIPAHLRMNIQVVDKKGRTLAMDRDLSKLHEQFGQRARSAFMRKSGSDWHRDGLTEWDFEPMPEHITTKNGAKAWPALVDQGSAVGMRLYDREGEAKQQHRAGVLRLLRKALQSDLKYVEKNSGLNKKNALHYAPLGHIDALKKALCEQALNSVAKNTWQVRHQQGFEAYISQVRQDLIPCGLEAGKTLSQVLAQYHEIQTLLRRHDNDWNDALDDIQSQIDDLVYEDFISDVKPDRLQHYPRYLQGMLWRLDKLASAPGKDVSRHQEIAPYWQRYLQHIETEAYTPALDRYRWLLEEWRISLFAQHLKTAEPVSAKRLEKAWEKV
jgi:ATP-dependent helicase HrpA